MRYSAKGYMALLRRLVKSKKKAHSRLRRKASAYRRRMIANPPCELKGDAKKVYQRLLKTNTGKQVARRFQKFWKIKCPPSIQMIKGGGSKITPLVGMGYTHEVHISDGDKGQRGRKNKVVRGRWTVCTEKSGKQVLLLTNRPLQPPLKEVGYAPETHYVPTPDVEKAGTHKAGSHWRHKHGEDDEHKGIPRKLLHFPKVYADRNGKVDGKSNFVYGKTPKGKITDWMYG